MRRIIKGAILGAFTVGAIAIPSAAMASTGGSNGQTGQLTGHANSAKYVDPFFGPVQCNETQHPAFDTVSCKSTSGAPLTNVSANQIGSVGWNSDFGASGHNTGVLNFTVSADGLSYTGQATYPNG